MRRWLALPFLAAASGRAVAQVTEFTQEQSDAFLQGAGVAGDDLAATIAVIIATFVFGGIAWIAYAAFQNWTDGRMSAGGVATLLLRAAALLIIAGVFLR